MANNFVGIKFGVLGASKSGESYELIKKQLNSLSNQIKFKVNIDRPYFTKQLQSLKAEMNKTLGNLKVDVSPKQTGSGSSTSGGTKETSATYEGTRKTLEQLYQTKLKLVKIADKPLSTVTTQEKAKELEELYAKQLSQLRESKDIDAEKVKLVEQYAEQLKIAQETEAAKIEQERTAKAQRAEGNVAASAMDIAKLQDKAASLSTTNGFDKIIARSKEAAELVSAFQDKVKSLGDDATKGQVKDLNTEFVQTQARLREIGEETNTTGNKIREAFSQRVIQAIALLLLTQLTKALKQVYNNVVKIDKAMTSLKIVTNANSEEMSNFADTVAQSAKKIGSSISDLIDSTTVFARLGYSLRDASILAEKTTIYSNVSDVAVDEATTNITAIIKAFNVGADELEGVLDQLIYVGNNFAISSGEIGEGMNNAASSLAANGNTLQQAIGILTAANVTVQNANKSSTAVRTIAARMAGSTTELEELGAETDSVLSSAKLDEKMRAYGVAILDATGNLRATYDVLADVAKIWDKLETTDRAAIAEMLSGTRQQNVFYSMMQNWGDAEAVVDQASNGYGALQEANEKYLDSIDGKVNQLKASWEAFSTSLLDSELVKFFIDVVKVLADVLNAFVSLGDGAPAKIAIITVAVIALSKAMTLLQNKLGTDLPTVMKALVTVIQSGAKSVKSALLSMVQNPYFYIVVLISAFTLFADKMPGIAQIIVGVTLMIAAAVTIMLKTINTQVQFFMANNPLGWILAIITAVVLAITSLVKGIISICNASTKAMEEAVEAAKESKEAWEDAVDELNEVDDKLQETKDRIAELQELSNNGTITLVQQEELDKLEQSVAGLEAQKKALEDMANIKKESAEKDAANAVDKILDEKLSDAYVQEDNTFWKGFLRVIASIGTLGMSDAFGGFGISDWSVKTKSAGDYVKEILGDWENATEQQRQYAMDFYSRLSEQKDMLSYHTGENLEQWQIDANDAYNTCWEYVHRFILAKNSDISEVWESILGMERFPDIKQKLKDIANSGGITAEALKSLYESDDTVKDMIDYLEQLGIFSWEDAQRVSGLVNQINSLADAAKSLEKLSFLDILDKIQEKFDSLSDVLSDIEESGIASADSIKTLLETYPSLMKYFDLKKYTGTDGKTYYQGYGLKDEYSGLSSNDIQRMFVTEYLQTYVDELAKCEEGTENYTTAQENLNNAIAVCATLLRSAAIEEETERLNANKDALEEQLDKYKDLIDIRKDLLETYKEEIDYQKELAQKQKNVADLETQLAIAKLDKSAAGQAKVRELQEELESAQDELDDFTLEKAIDMLTAELDESYDDYKKFIDDEIEKITDAIDNLKSTVNPGVTVPKPTEESPDDDSGGNGGGTDETIQPKERWTSWQDAADAGFSNIAGASTSERGRVKNWVNPNTGNKYTSYQEYLDVMYEKYMGKAPKYHGGGFVDDYSDLQSNEVFAKLLRGEFVSTPAQMDRFINETLPKVAAHQNGDATINYNSPLVEIKCGTVNDDTLPKLNDMVNKAVEKIKKDMSSALSRTGYRKQY